MKIDAYALKLGARVDFYSDFGVSHMPDVKLGGFRSRLEASRMSSHIEGLGYNVC